MPPGRTPILSGIGTVILRMMHNPAAQFKYFASIAHVLVDAIGKSCH